jgi:cytochrome P450 / NADPH-cytochrome P450 reductase
MAAAGAGIAPFRGFIQERAAQIAAGRKLAPASLFFGCRGLGVDDLYREKLDRWEGMGAGSVRRAMSRKESKEVLAEKDFSVGFIVWIGRSRQDEVRLK